MRSTSLTASLTKGLSLPLLAYVCMRIWAALAINLHATMSPGTDVAALVPLALGMWMLGRLAVDATGVLLSSKIRSVSCRMTLSCASLGLLELGTLLITSSANGWIGGIGLLIAGGFLCGLGTEVIALLWLEAISHESFAVARKLILLDMGTEAALAPLCLAPLGLNLIICLALPLLSVMGLRRILELKGSVLSNRSCATYQLSLKTVLPVGVGVALLFFGSHFLQNGLNGSVIDDLIGTDASLWSAIIGRWVALAALVPLMRFADEMRFECLFATTALLAILGFLALPLSVAPGSFFFFRTLTIAACFLVGKAVNLVVVSVASRSNVQPLKLLAAGNLVIYLGHTSSILASTSATAVLQGIDPSSWLYPVTAGSILLLAISGMWLLRDRTINAFLWQHSPSGKAKAPHADLAQFVTDRGLTEREAQVLELLVSGRSIPFIAQALLLSQATIKSHTLHIYQKCDVHNRQDLISLVQNEPI